MDNHHQSNNAKPKKISNTLIVFVACVLGLGIGLLTINYWHTSNCTGKTSTEIDEFLDAFNRRLLQSESLIHKNEILMNKVIHTLEANLYRLEKKESEELNKLAKDEAIRISLYLNNHPAPPMPEFPLDKEYEDAEKLADVVDDLFSKRLDDKNDALVDSKEFEEEEEIESITDAEAIKICSEWKDKYNVVVGASWGNLPYDLQQKWLEYSCDYHLQDAGKEGSSEEEEPSLE